MVLTVDDVADAPDRQAEHRAGAAGVEYVPDRVVSAARPHVDAERRAEQAAPLADTAFGQRKDAQPLAVGEDAPVLPHVEETRADKPQRDHPREPVAGALEVGDVLLQEPETDARRGDDPEDREHAVPGDQERAEPKDVRVEVDDDRQRHLSGFGYGALQAHQSYVFGQEAEAVVDRERDLLAGEDVAQRRVELALADPRLRARRLTRGLSPL